MSEITPKPCPFCDTVPEVKISHYDGSRFVSPSCCFFQDGTDLTIKQWNERPEEDRLRARIAQLEANTKNIEYWLNNSQSVLAKMEAELRVEKDKSMTDTIFMTRQDIEIAELKANAADDKFKIMTLERRIKELEAEVESWESTR